MTRNKRFLTDQIAREIEELRISPIDDQTWVQNLRRPNSFQPIPEAASALESINIEEDIPNRRNRSKKGKRVRFDLNGDALELDEAAQPVDEIQPRTRGVRRAWSDTGFDAESLLEQTSADMERLALNVGNTSVPNKRVKGADYDAIAAALNCAASAQPLPDVEDLPVSKRSSQPATKDSLSDAMDLDSAEEPLVFRVNDPYRALILRQPSDNPLERLIRRELEQNSMALVVYEDPKENITLGPLLRLLEEQRSALAASPASDAQDIEMQDDIDERQSIESVMEL